MTQPNTKPEPKSTYYWVVTVLAWSLMTFLAAMAVWSLVNSRIEDTIGFAVFTAMVAIALFQPKWFQRFARFYTHSR